MAQRKVLILQLGIIPYIVGMLVAISMLRTSGTFDVIMNGIKELFAAQGTDTRLLTVCRQAFIKPLSGSGARGMMLDTMKTFGADSFAGSSFLPILQGTSDTTFMWLAYILVR
jgi:spore maturation protein SpmB